jgi:glutathione S-transferase
LLTENTTNGKKVQILLEELHEIYGISWSTHLVDLETDEQKKSWFLRLNPNGKSFNLFPTLTDSGGSFSTIILYRQLTALPRPNPSPSGCH